MAYTLDAGGLDLVLEVIHVSSLLQHEQVLPGMVQRLVYEFKNMAKLHNPVIVDDRHSIVLDGNHRAFVFKEIGFLHIPVCKIDYFNENVLLKYWYRIVKGFHDIDELLETIVSAGGAVTPVACKEELRDGLRAHPLWFGIQHGDQCRVISMPASKVPDGVAACDEVHRIEQWLTEHGHEIEFVPCQYMNDEHFCKTLHDDDLVIWTPHLTKEMVVAAAMEGKVFAPKSTRHVIPARPLNVNVPVHWFTEHASLEEMNLRFSSYLHGKDVKRFGPGQVIDGRFYSEEIFIFFDKKQ